MVWQQYSRRFYDWLRDMPLPAEIINIEAIFRGSSSCIQVNLKFIADDPRYQTEKPSVIFRHRQQRKNHSVFRRTKLIWEAQSVQVNDMMFNMQDLALETAGQRS